MPLIIGEINPILTWSANCFITNSKGAGVFEITSTKLYVPVAIPAAIGQYKTTTTIEFRVQRNSRININQKY